MKQALALLLATGLGSSSALSLSLCPSALAKIPKQEPHEQTEAPSTDYFKTGMEKMKQRDIDGAIDSFLQAVYFARNNYAPPAYYWLGFCYASKNDKAYDLKALDALKKSVEQSLGGNPESWNLMAEIYLRNNRLEEAEQACTHALSSTVGQAPLEHYEYGKILEKKGELSEAERHYLMALGDGPWVFTAAWMALAENYMKQQQWLSAVQQFHNMLVAAHLKRLKGVPFEQVFLDLGKCLLQKGDHQGAIDNWRHCLEANPNNPEAHFDIALILDSEKHMSAAVKEYKESVRTAVDPKILNTAKQRIALLEQTLAPAETAPEAEKPSLQMRAELQQTQQKQQQMQKQQDNRPFQKDSGF